jgi:hypothetical protein
MSTSRALQRFMRRIGLVRKKHPDIHYSYTIPAIFTSSQSLLETDPRARDYQDF